MSRREPPAPIALLLALVLAGAGVVAPLLDAGPSDRGARVESTHDPSRCEVGHDHLLCRLLAGSDAGPAPDIGARAFPDAEPAAGRRTTDAPTPPSRSLPDPRGPPAAG